MKECQPLQEFYIWEIELIHGIFSNSETYGVFYCEKTYTIWNVYSCAIPFEMYIHMLRAHVEGSGKALPQEKC